MNHLEIENCVTQAKTGDNEALLKLFKQYKPFIFKTAGNFNIRNYDMYDMVQIGYVTLINAVIKYRCGSHTFSSYAYNAIKNAFRYTARQNSKCSKDLSLNTPVAVSEETSTEFIDCIPSQENIDETIMSSLETEKVRKAASLLPPDELELVIMVYYSGASLKTYAQKKNMSYLQAIRKKNKILKKLGTALKDR